MNLIDPADLPKSAADGPQSWGEAWTNLASTTSSAQQMIENTNSDRNMLSDIYAQRIAKIEQLTGQTLENPMTRSEIGIPSFLQPTDRAAYGYYENDFNKRVSTLQQQFPALANAFPETVDDQMNRMRREAQQASGQAALNPNLDPISRFAAQMAGGLAGAARDPFQWQTAIAGGGGGSAGGSVAGRIGKTMVTEFMLNGGQEAVLQAASQPRKKAAGLEYGLGDALANIGLAGTFGALFGGTLEAGHALAGLYRMGDDGAAVASRVLEGKPQPGDVETMAKAMGVELQPEQLQQLNRSFEERVLDDHMIGAAATPDQQRIFEAAKRYAEDPDNNPPPEIVERAIADEQLGPARTLTADDYERIYGGDPDAIDDLRGVMQAESLDDAARMIDDQTRQPSQQTVAAAAPAADPDVYSGELDVRHGFGGHNQRVGVPPKLIRDFTGERYDANAFGNDAVYLDADGHWTEPSQDIRLTVGEFAPGKVRFDKALVITPENLDRIVKRVGIKPGKAREMGWDRDLLFGDDIAEYAHKNGYDGIITTGFHEKIKGLDEEQALQEKHGVWYGVMQDQVVSLNPDAITFDGRTFMPGDADIPQLPGLPREIRDNAARVAIGASDRGETLTLKSPSGDAHLTLRRDGQNLKVGITSVSKASRGQGKARQLYEEAVRLADENGGVLRSDISVSNDALRVYNSLSRRGYDVRRNPDAVRTDKGWIAPDQPGQNWVFEVRPRPDPNVVVDPLEGQAIRPRTAIEPTDAEAMRVAEEQAGVIGEPVIDANGNPQSLFDFIPITDRDGNVRLVSPSEALEIADQGNILADLLEVCQV